MDDASEQDKQLERAVRLHQLLTLGHDDEWGEHQPGLLEWYVVVLGRRTERSQGGAAGGKHAPLPFNVDAVDFVAGRYWSNPDVALAAASRYELDDPQNYHQGFEPTVLGLDALARRALGFGPAEQQPHVPGRAHRGVIAALTFLGAASGTLLERAPTVANVVHGQAARLASHSRAMAWGSRFSAGRGPCPHCHRPDSVVSDEDRAFCDNTACRREDGTRHCWRIDPATDRWIEVDEPDVRGRGRATDEQLSRWAEPQPETAAG